LSDKIQLAHGGGGKLSAKLIEDEILPRFGKKALKDLPDAASLTLSSGKLIFSTDSFVVNPIEFPGGNIGDLAIHGTVNDISAAGGKPLWLSLGLILEEGLPIETLRKILDSVRDAAQNCGVEIATGDTKVVPKGQCDKIYINTSGIGEALEGFDLKKNRIKEGDCVIISGNIGDHGTAVMTARENIKLENGPESDSAPTFNLVEALSECAKDISFMRDPTRGGTAAVLNEIVAGSNVGILLKEENLPVSSETAAVSEMLGLDPLNVACEGRMIVVCDRSVSDIVLRNWWNMPEGENAALIGTVTNDKGRVSLRTATGGKRLVDVPMGEILPRIC
jgi:hydrogenase expression/formation protein HypE